MKTLLINPDTLRLYTTVGGLSAFPLGLGYIAAVLEKHHHVKVIDAQAENLDDHTLRKTVSEIRPEIVGITSDTLTFQRAIETAKIVKQVDKGTFVVVGGAHSNALPSYPLKYDCFDISVYGEGERTAIELWDRIDRGKSYEDVKGISFRGKDGIVVNPRREFIENLDELPFPARHLFPMETYRSDLHLSVRPTYSIGTSRGCPFSCAFCSNNVAFGRKHRFRSPKNVADEIELMINQYDAKGIFFREDLFTVNKQRVIDICDEIVKRGLDFRWECESRVDTIDEEMLWAMKKAGCELIWFGVESGSQRILDYLNKKITLPQIREACNRCYKVGIKTMASFMIGVPGETIDEIQKTIEFAEELSPNLDHAAFNIFTGYPTSPLYEFVKQNRLYEKEVNHGILIIKTAEFNTPVLEEIQKYAKTRINKSKQMKDLTSGQKDETQGERIKLLPDVLTYAIDARDAQIHRLEYQIHRLEYQIHRLEYQIHRLDSQIWQIQHSIPMQLVSRYQRVVEKLLHTGTRRRDYYELGLAGIRVILTEGWRSFFRQAWGRLTRRGGGTKKHRHDLPKFNASISEKEAGKLVLPMPSDKPETSIVIPAYNQLRYTLNCLKSIAENTDGDYEVVVVDDASTDETAKALRKVKNLRLITNEQNMGFIESGNRGASASKGKYILFLNNDTMVTKGWLQPLLQLIKREDVGAVGSMLVYPNGTLQEAGTITWNDGSGWNYGRGDDPDKPEYNYVREIDYCPGASVLVKRELFEQVGGFDERYKPAYKEIVDLCFSIRSLGYRVMHQPMSVVVHFEGITGGRDIHSGVKKYQEINRPKFAEKWRSVLQEEHYAPGTENIFLARERIAGKRIKKIILIIDDKVPDYDKYAGALGMYQYARLFADLGFKVIFLPADLRATEPYTGEMQQLGIEVLYGKFDFDSWLRKNGKHINYVWLSRPNIASKYIDKIKENTGAKILYCGRDLHYLRWLRRYEVERSEQALKTSQRLKEMELMLFKNADAILTFSTFEADTISRDLPQKRHISVIPPYLYDEFPFEGFPSDYVLPPFDDRKDIVFLGGFGHGPNVDAVIWFVKECFPHLAAQLPDVKLFVIGSDPPKDIMDLQSENIVVTGHVKDLKQYFQKIKLCVAPVRWGAGVKGKIVTSMYYGVPVVTTSLGAEGMSLTDGEHVFIADTPEIFAAKVVELYSNRGMWGKLSKNSLQYVKERFSKKAALEKLLPILDVPQCYICGASYKLPDPETVTNFRETRLCPNCGASKRKIDLARVVLKVIGSDASCLSEASGDLRDLKIYLLESCGPVHAVLSGCPNLVCSEYWSGVSPGETRGNVRCEDVQNLTFPDASFDMVITQDVFEHVANPEAGLKEIHRVLKPGGYHIFTVPFNRRSAQSVTRARIEGKETIHVLPAVYHGDSLRYGGCLVFTDFGPDIMEMMKKIDFEVETYEDEHPEYINGYNIVFVCRKI